MVRAVLGEQKGIMKLRNILEGLPEAQFNAEEYMNLYTCVTQPARPLRRRATAWNWAQCLSLSLRVPRLDAALLPLLATASGQRDDTAPVAPACGPPACLVACPGVRWAVSVASPTGASRHSP